MAKARPNGETPVGFPEPDDRCNCDDLEDLSACPVHGWEECGGFDEDPEAA